MAATITTPESKGKLCLVFALQIDTVTPFSVWASFIVDSVADDDEDIDVKGVYLTEDQWRQITELKAGYDELRQQLESKTLEVDHLTTERARRRSILERNEGELQSSLMR